MKTFDDDTGNGKEIETAEMMQICVNSSDSVMLYLLFVNDIGRVDQAIAKLDID